MSDLSARVNEHPLFARTLIATDDSDASLAAIDVVAPSVKAAGGQVFVVFVRQRPVMFESVGIDTSSAWELVEESLDAKEKEAERDVTAHLQAHGIGATFLVRDGDPAHEILDAATEHDASLLVIGSPLHGALGSILLSSVTEYLVHHCTRPLLVIRPQDSAS